MCGIAGYWGKKELPDSILKQTLDSMNHRGPDGSGLFHKKLSKSNVYLLHTRLSIIDLSHKADQPMNYNESALVFNGELYNYIEKRKQLEKEFSCSFQTSSDTEVFLKMLHYMGVKTACANAEGMFAFAFFDAKAESLYIGKDFFGEKPLFYINLNHGFYFASEIKTLISLVGMVPGVNRAKLLSYLYMGYKNLYRDDDTFFKDIKVLPRNQAIKINSDSTCTRFEICEYVPKEITYLDTGQAVSATREALLKAMELRLRSDVPIAFCMSGGIDSMSLISMAKREFNYDVHGFTIQNKDSRFDESELVDLAVSDLGISHTYVKTKCSDFLLNLKEYISSRCAPVSTISYYVHALLMEKVKEHGYKVSISGTGADELFTGYYDHYLYYLAISTKNYEQALQNWEQNVLPNVRNPDFKNPRLFSKSPTFREYLYKDYQAHNKYVETEKKLEDFNFNKNLLRNRMLNELFHEVVPVILHEDDMNSMQQSIENRSPFLDKSLLSLTDSISTELMIQDGYNKYILRESMKGILPEKVRLNRKKIGFNSSLFEVLPSDFNKNINSFFPRRSAIFEYIERDFLFSLFKANNRDYEKFLFNVINAHIFLEKFHDQ